jgi:hypothetical protein
MTPFNARAFVCLDTHGNAAPVALSPTPRRWHAIRGRALLAAWRSGISVIALAGTLAWGCGGRTSDGPDGPSDQSCQQGKLTAVSEDSFVGTWACSETGANSPPKTRLYAPGKITFAFERGDAADLVWDLSGTDPHFCCSGIRFNVSGFVATLDGPQTCGWIDLKRASVQVTGCGQATGTFLAFIDAPEPYESLVTATCTRN